MINTRLLKSQMFLCGLNTRSFADAMNWGRSTAYRKINGKVAFTAPEMQACIKLLNLDLTMAGDIFFPQNCPEGQKC